VALYRSAVKRYGVDMVIISLEYMYGVDNVIEYIITAGLQTISYLDMLETLSNRTRLVCKCELFG
jgi:hypothetical protein